MRRCHILPGNKNSEHPHDAIWLDTETDGVRQPDGSEKHVLRFGYAAASRSPRAGRWTRPAWHRFTTPAELWDWVEDRTRPKIRLYLFAHNWAFDAPVLDMFNELPRRGWTLTGSVIESPPIILTWKRDKVTLKVVDTLNIWRVPLATLGASIGLDKLPMPEPDAPAELWEAYGRRDVEVIMKACLMWWEWLEANDLGGFAPTLASQAFRTYRHRFMPVPILIDDNEPALELARSCYVGGRVECFQLGKIGEPVYRLDINSQYPFQMRNFPMPTKLLGVYRRVGLDELADWLTEFAVCAEVELETSEPAYPVIRDERLIFPVGSFRARLSTPELRHALEAGHVRRVLVAAAYEQAHIFRDYVDHFYTERQRYKAAGNEVSAWLCKIMLNSLYGKFGQRGRVYEKVADVDNLDIQVWTEKDIETGEVFHLRQYAGILEQLTDEPEAVESHPAIAAHVTAYARMHLWALIRMAGVRNVFYCDTDSVWTNGAGCARLRHHLDDNELGMLKLEGVETHCVIHGPKDYEVGDTVKIKGVRKSAVKIREAVFTQDRFSTIKGLLRTGDLTAPVVTPTTKELKRIYTKGRVSKSGRVSPLRLREC